MKFLRLAFYVMIAQLVLSGCAGEGVEETSSSSSSEINFDAYLGRNASTRAGETNITSLKGTEGNSGFGVFARYNHNGPLMNNEHLTWKEKENRWGYTNTRYWPNEGSVDFYAFAPYLKNVANLVCAPDSSKDNPTCIEFTSSNSNVDLVWDVQKNKTVPTSPTDGKVKFQFKHALARLGFDITANPKLEENGAVIIVKEVKLYGETENEGAFDIKGYLNLENGGWSRVKDVGTRVVYTWTPTGAEDGTSFKLSPSQLDHTCGKIGNALNSYLCIIPQVKYVPFYLQITYTVKQGTFEEEVKVKKNLLEVRNPPEVSNPSFPFERGKAYVFHLKLSLNPIDFSISTTVEDFAEGKNETMFL
mgnify:FL=1